jgi:ParB family transcriptional regulator, chromosome partitioning protein
MSGDIGHLSQVSTARILPNPENPRLIFRPEEAENLIASIRTIGIQVPLSVYRDGESYFLIDGERRWRAAQKLNLKTVPALVQKKPTVLDNLLLMYNIHALREQWDYFTIATGLERIIKLVEKEERRRPTEAELSTLTGLTRGMIRRCLLLINLPIRYREELLRELELPKSQQVLSEDLLIEMEKSLKAVNRRLYGNSLKLDPIRNSLITKFRDGRITAVTDFRQLTKIATAVDSLELSPNRAKRAFESIADPKSDTGIRQVYERVAEHLYDEKRLIRSADSLTEYLSEVTPEKIDQDLRKSLIKLYKELQKVLGRRG